MEPTILSIDPKLLTDSEYTLYEIAKANWDTHYLSNDGKVKKRCFGGRFCKILHLHKFKWIQERFFPGDLHLAKQAILKTLENNRNFASMDAPKLEEFLLATNINYTKLVERVNRKRKTLSRHDSMRIHNATISYELIQNGHVKAGNRSLINAIFPKKPTPGMTLLSLEEIEKLSLTPNESTLLKIATADWKKQYLTTSAEVKDKVVWYQKNISHENLETAKDSIFQLIATNGRSELTGTEATALYMQLACNFNALDTTPVHTEQTTDRNSRMKIRKITVFNVIDCLTTQKHKNEAKQLEKLFSYTDQSIEVFCMQKPDSLLEKLKTT